MKKIELFDQDGEIYIDELKKTFQLDEISVDEERPELLAIASQYSEIKALRDTLNYEAIAEDGLAIAKILSKKDSVPDPKYVIKNIQETYQNAENSKTHPEFSNRIKNDLEAVIKEQREIIIEKLKKYHIEAEIKTSNRKESTEKQERKTLLQWIQKNILRK